MRLDGRTGRRHRRRHHGRGPCQYAAALRLRRAVTIITDSELKRSAGYAADWRPRFADAYRLELQAWVDSLSGGNAGPLASALDGLLASAVADAVIVSMHSGGATTSVRVPEV